jgi:hypothetical protein
LAPVFESGSRKQLRSKSTNDHCRVRISSLRGGEEQQPNDADPAWVLAIAYRLLERQTEPLQLIARQKNA